MEYYVYTYFYEDGTAYYVGKGSGRRCFNPHSVPVPNRNLIQRFYFNTEIESWDTEVQLISFYGRIIDGGTLLNKSIGGGNGPIGCKLTRTPQWSHNHALAQTGEKNHRFGKIPHNAKTYLITTPADDVYEVIGLQRFAREHGLNRRSLCSVANGKMKHHKGYTVKRVD